MEKPVFQVLSFFVYKEQTGSPQHSFAKFLLWCLNDDILLIRVFIFSHKKQIISDSNAQILTYLSGAQSSKYFSKVFANQFTNLQVFFHFSKIRLGKPNFFRQIVSICVEAYFFRREKNKYIYYIIQMYL
jgi:hypothetical protein